MVSKCLKFVASRAVEITAIILTIIFWPNLPPHGKFSEPYSISPARPFEGKLALNERLNNAEILFKGELHGPEAFAVYNGELYTTVLGGEVVKIVGDKIIPIVKFGKPCKGLYEEHICGRPLGLKFDKNGVLYVADAYYGLFKVNIKTGKYEQLVSVDDEIANKKPKLPNSLAIAANGDIYWTDSSSDFVLHNGIYEMLSDGSGRLIHYNAKTKKNNVLLDNIHFANGILLSKDESFIVVSETGRNRLIRYHLTGTKKGSSDVFLDGLPGVPDNLQSDEQGGFFVPLCLSTDNDNPSFLKAISEFPLLRKLMARLQGLTQAVFKLADQVYPNEWAQKAVHLIGSFHSVWYVTPISKRLTILHVSEDGRVIDSLHALDAKINAISDAIVYKNGFYLGSPANDFLVRISLDKAGLKHLKAPSTSTAHETKSTTPPKPIKKETPPPTKIPPTRTPKTTATGEPPKQKTTEKVTTSSSKETPPAATSNIPKESTTNKPNTANPEKVKVETKESIPKNNKEKK